MFPPDVRGKGGEGEGQQVRHQAGHTARLEVYKLDLQREVVDVVLEEDVGPPEVAVADDRHLTLRSHHPDLYIQICKDRITV